MKIITRIVQIIVGLLFIVSGLVKANDPLGLGYKMQEFFDLWKDGLKNGHFFLRGPMISLYNFLDAHSLFLAVVMITLEICAGVALLIGWSRKFVVYLLLVLMVFFTFLTGYAYLSGKFTNCGCFGDCLPITPFTSFMKDVVLTAMVLVLVFGQKYIMRTATALSRSVIVGLALVFSVCLQIFVLNYLPLVDCLPFKKGNNIAQQMKPPPGSVPDSIAIRFIYEKNGKQYEFAPENLPADFTTYKYVDRIDKLVRKGNAEPAIKGFSLTGAETTDSTGETKTMDSADIVLQQPVAIMVFALDFDNAKWIGDIKHLMSFGQSMNIPVYVISTDRNEAMKAFGPTDLNNVHFFNTDFTIVRTVARTNPTVLALTNGTIVNKFGKNRLKDIERSFSH